MSSLPRPLNTRDVFLFVPNLIGYSRIVLALLSFYFITTPRHFLPLYALSCLLDVADGFFARRLGQCSRMGAVLDMVTDRSTTAGLLCHLCVVYPRTGMLWQSLLGLDLSSHYMHMYATLAAGAASHKKLGGEHHWLLRLYYTEREVMFVACAANEAFFVALYMLAYENGPVFTVLGYSVPMWLAVAVFSAPIWAFKQAMNVVQLVGAAKKLAELDVKEAVSLKQN